MQKPILNVDEVEFAPRPAGFAASGAAAAHFDARTGQVGTRIGARKLGYNITAVPPGKAAFPFHSHRVNEEMFMVLEGNGEIRMGTQTFPIRRGDIIACPPGGPETAHQIRNTGTSELCYLAVSTRVTPEIAEYPDSGKFGVYAEFSADADGTPQFFRFIGRDALSVNYWDGEGEE